MPYRKIGNRKFMKQGENSMKYKKLFSAATALLCCAG